MRRSSRRGKNGSVWKEWRARVTRDRGEPNGHDRRTSIRKWTLGEYTSFIDGVPRAFSGRPVCSCLSEHTTQRTTPLFISPSLSGTVASEQAPPAPVQNLFLSHLSRSRLRRRRRRTSAGSIHPPHVLVQSPPRAPFERLRTALLPQGPFGVLLLLLLELRR